MAMRGLERALGVIKIETIALGLALCLLPTAADAHTALKGMGRFWSGAAHLLTSLDQLAFLLGLAIWASFQDDRLDATIIRAAFLGVLAGAWVGSRFTFEAGSNLLAVDAGLMMVVGLAGALALRVRVVLILGVTSIGGLLSGAANADPAPGIAAALFSLGGSTAAAAVLSYGLLASRRLESHWGSVARRAGASWIAATGLIVLTFSLSRNVGHG